MAKSDLPEPREWTSGESTFVAYPEHGARLAKWSRRDQPIIHWPERPAPPLAKVRGGNPILFPFAARTFAKGTEGQWLWQNEVRSMPRHGFARGGAFEATDIRDDGFRARLRPTEDDRARYPFDYEFSVDYRFEPHAFEVTFTLANRGEDAVPWSAGHHFYFPIPAARRAGTQLQIPATKAWHHGADGALVPAALPGEMMTFEAPEMVDRLHTHLRRPEVRFGPLPGAQRVTLTFGGDIQATEWATVVTWTERNDSPFYCVEPWMGPPNGPGHGHGLAQVPPGHTGAFKVRVEASPP